MLSPIHRGAMWFLAASLAPAAAVEPFFAAPQASGSIAVKLHPMENVTPGTPALVTFGIPFPPASVTVGDLSRIRVLNNGAEAAVSVTMATPWRLIDQPAADAQYVRVATIQILHAFRVRYPDYEQITVEWGVTPRAQERTFENPRNGWHAITAGSFKGVPGVSEPDVYALLPKQFLSLGVLTLARALPFSDEIPEGRDDPAAFKARFPFSDLQLIDYSFKNNFYTAINQDDPRATNVIDFRRDFEPWLYDRVATFFHLYLRSGFLKALREAVQNAEFFRTQIADDTSTPPICIGIFQLKRAAGGCGNGSNNAMYSNVEGLAYSFWLTGDPLLLSPIRWAVIHHNTNDMSSRWSPAAGAWTERGTGLNTLANVVMFELFGDKVSADRVKSAIQDYAWHQNGADGLLPSNRLDGALYHLGSQHGDGLETDYVASPWMTVLIVNALIRAYGVTKDPAIPDMLIRIARWESKITRFDGDSEYDTSPVSHLLRYPLYIVRADGSGSRLDATSAAEHALEVAASISWGSYFARLMGKAEPELDAAVNDLYLTYTEGVGYWLRPLAPASGLTAFRMTPPRKISWEHRPSGSLSWLMEQNGSRFELGTRVQLKAPEAGATVRPPGSFNLAAEPLQGNPARVEFLRDGQVIGAVTKAPFDFAWHDVPEGTYILAARTTDIAGRVSLSQNVPVAVTPENCMQPFGFARTDLTFPMQSGTFPVSVTATPLQISGITGSPGVSIVLSPAQEGVDNRYPLDFSAAAVKFDAVSGHIVARDELAYKDSPIPWVPATAYQIRFELDTATHTYNAFVTAAGGGEQQVAAGYRFHPSFYGAVQMLNAVRTVADGGAIQTCRGDFPSVETAPPEPPRGLYAATVDSSHVELTWIPPDRTDFVRVERKGPEGDFAEIGRQDSPQTSFSDTTVAAVTEYQYRCRAVNAVGASLYSTPIKVRTTEAGTTTVMLRQGAAAYSGSTDLSMSNKFAEGLVLREPELVVWDLSGPTGYTAKSLIRFEGLPVPRESKVLAAKLSLTFLASWQHFLIRAYSLIPAWDAAARNFGWFNRTADKKWNEPGASAAGLDYRPSPAATFTLDGDTSVVQTVEADLDPVLVQQWVEDPAVNQGIVLVNQTTDATARIHSTRAAHPLFRPRLSITYRVTP